MRALRLEAIGQVAVRDVADPRPGPAEVTVRVQACGICGTDRHIVRGDYPAALPVTLGHECAGSVVAVGTGADLAVGTRVALDPNIACGMCHACRRGHVALCSRRMAIGVDRDGGLATYVTAPVAQAYALPDGMPAEWGALCEPLACCLHGLDLAPIQPGMNVTIIGGGVIGQLMTQLACLAGATSVTLVTRQASRRSLAENLGATATIDPRAVDPVLALTATSGPAPGGSDVVLECAGTVQTFEQALAMARRGGTVLVFGVAPRGDMARVRPYDIFERELRVIGAYLNPLTHGRAVALAATGRLSLDALITHRIAITDVAGVLMAAPTAGEVKAMVVA